MALYNDKIKSFVTGLSDFWLLYFKEIDQLEVFYKGTEILIGQSYLDLLSLLLNNSLQDTTIFNKEFFKLLILSETDITYRAGTTPEGDRYLLELPDNIVFARHLNNKILTPTVGLDKDVDYYLNEETRSLEFTYDPTNAYRELTFGVDNGQFRVRSRLQTGANISIHLNDVGGALLLSRTDYAVTISYDGPASGGSTTATAIVQLLNTDVQTQSLLFSEVTGLGTGTASPAGTTGLTPLARVAVSALDGFATNHKEVVFAGKLTATTIGDWVSAGVEKGDTLRFIVGPTIGTAIETSISLVRSDALYQNAGGDTVALASDQIDFVILREPENAVSLKEPIANSGIVVQSAFDGTVVAATRTLSSPTAVFSPVHEGDIIELVGVNNVGNFRILDVVSATEVVLAAPGLIDETPLYWAMHSVVEPTNIAADGVLVNNADGTATFTSALANFLATHVGTVLKIERAGAMEIYAVAAYTSATVLQLTADPSVAGGTGLDWGLANVYTADTVVVYSAPIGWVKPNTLTVDARRLLDNQVVLEDRDFTVAVDTGTVTPITIWRTSTGNTTSYNYRIAVVENTVPLQSASDGTLTPGSPNVFTASTAVFTTAHLGYAINIGNSGLPVGGVTNNGAHYIAAVLSPTSVELTNDKSITATVDPNNGILTWELLRRGVLAVKDITAFVERTSFWIPDALVDRFHLYNTFGYLINKFERSSEAYRSLIRGIFQLFMLGPTLERFESAINTVAGIDVIRDNGEILLAYSNEAAQSGIDGTFDFTARTFTAPTAVFTVSSLSDYIYAVDGFNSGKLFKIISVTDATTVVLDQAPVSAGPNSWELTTTAQHSVVTSRTTYSFPRNIPLRSAVRDPASVGVTIFQAFEVLTNVFTVTDYLEDPNWFDFVQIPPELMTNQSSTRRQSTPALFENVISPADGGQVGDPGFIIGGDSEGFIAPSVLLRDDAGALDGVTTGDANYAFTNAVYFDSPTGAFTSADIGNTVVTSPGTTAEASYRIQGVTSTTQVAIEAFVDVEDVTGLDWEIRSSPLAKRHKAAFVILNQFLKYHLFTVDFDSSLLGQVASTLLSDLQELVFVAKPTYTYVIVSPSSLFQEIIRANEALEYAVTWRLGGGAGSQIAVNANPLLVIGSSWHIGTWYRYVEATSTFAAPAASIATPLGTPTAGYKHYVNKVYITPADFTSGGTVIQVCGDVSGFTAVASGTGDMDVAVVSDVATVTVPTATFIDHHLFATIRITGSGLGNDGDYRIGAVQNALNVVIDASSFVTETGLNWELLSSGGLQGQIEVLEGGEVVFQDVTSGHVFNVAHEGDYVRRPYVSFSSNQAFLLDEYVSTTRMKVAARHRVGPLVTEPDAHGAVSGEVLTVAFGDVIFSKSMAIKQRAVLTPSTRNTQQYFINFTSGPNPGSSFAIYEYLAANQVRVLGAADTTGSDFYISVRTTPGVVDEVADWEHVREQIEIRGDVVDLSNTPTQDVNVAVGYTAYGVREPSDPTTETFDAAEGDTMYSIGMPDPRQPRGKSRTGKDTDLREDPIEITRI